MRFIQSRQRVRRTQSRFRRLSGSDVVRTWHRRGPRHSLPVALFSPMLYSPPATPSHYTYSNPGCQCHISQLHPPSPTVYTFTVTVLACLASRSEGSHLLHSTRTQRRSRGEGAPYHSSHASGSHAGCTSPRWCDVRTSVDWGQTWTGSARRTSRIHCGLGEWRSRVRGGMVRETSMS